ncbi:MAG: DUF1501 domain-containing protein [Planctomycetota bacterium]
MASDISGWHRRRFLETSGMSLVGATASPWLAGLASRVLAREQQQRSATVAGERRRQCVLLWMSGGAAQTDTFDMKPGHANGGEFREIQTQAPGLRFSEHLPRLAQQADRLAVIRSLSTKEGDHGRGTYLMRTGHPPQGPVRYPSLGASVGKELAQTLPQALQGVPSYVAISPFRAFNQAAYGPGFLGARYAPLTVGATDQPQGTQPADDDGYARLTVDDLEPPAAIGSEQRAARLALWETLQAGFLKTRRAAGPEAQDTLYRRALELMNHEVARAFDLSTEPAKVREAYSKGRFGQGCLLARRLLERGVPFVEVTLGAATDNLIGWDTHQNNFATVKNLCGELDQGWSQLMTELSDRGLLDSVTLIWMGEFGRTPVINPQAGRDHFPAAWSCVMAGGGIRGGQAYGHTSADGLTVEEGKVNVGDVLATLCTALGVDPNETNISEVGRPIKIAEGQVIKDLVQS